MLAASVSENSSELGLVESEDLVLLVTSIPSGSYAWGSLSSDVIDVMETSHLDVF